MTWNFFCPTAKTDYGAAIATDYRIEPIVYYYVKVKKGSFYIAQYSVRWTAQSALHFLPPLVDLFIPTPTRLPGSILARQQLRAKAKSLTFPPLSIARCSFIQLSEQGRQCRERKCPIFETVTKRDSNPGSLDCESGILPLSYRAPRAVMTIYRMKMAIIQYRSRWHNLTVTVYGGWSRIWRSNSGTWTVSWRRYGKSCC